MTLPLWAQNIKWYTLYIISIKLSYRIYVCTYKPIFEIKTLYASLWAPTRKILSFKFWKRFHWENIFKIIQFFIIIFHINVVPVYYPTLCVFGGVNLKIGYLHKRKENNSKVLYLSWEPKELVDETHDVIYFFQICPLI